MGLDDKYGEWTEGRVNAWREQMKTSYVNTDAVDALCDLALKGLAARSHVAATPPAGWREALRQIRVNLDAGGTSASNHDFLHEHGGALLDKVEEALEGVAVSSTRRSSPHCQNGTPDICLAGRDGGVVCPEDSCDIDDGIRKPPGSVTVTDHMYIAPECHAKGCQFLVLSAIAPTREKQLLDALAMAILMSDYGDRCHLGDKFYKPISLKGNAHVRTPPTFVEWATQRLGKGDPTCLGEVARAIKSAPTDGSTNG